MAMQYPRILLPALGYKQITVDLSRYFICRTTEDTLWISQIGKNLPESALYKDSKELFDYSTNLPGHFKLKHNYLELCGEKKKDFRQEWDFQRPVEVPVYNEDFKEVKSKGWFFIPIGEIHNKIELPITKPKNIVTTVVSEIVHTPTCSNFWHFSIRWKEPDGTYISPSDSAWKRLITGTMRAKLNELATIETPDLFILPKDAFSNE